MGFLAYEHLIRAPERWLHRQFPIRQSHIPSLMSMETATRFEFDPHSHSPTIDNP